jgi:hypothetical protein
MKTLIICALLGGLVIGMCGAGITYVNQATTQIGISLQNCITYAQREDIQGAKTALQETKDQWQNKRKILMMYTDQEILDDVDDQLDYMEALADHHPEEFVPAAVQCIGKLRELKQREVISVYSWF